MHGSEQQRVSDTGKRLLIVFGVSRGCLPDRCFSMEETGLS